MCQELGKYKGLDKCFGQDKCLDGMDEAQCLAAGFEYCGKPSNNPAAVTPGNPDPAPVTPATASTQVTQVVSDKARDALEKLVSDGSSVRSQDGTQFTVAAVSTHTTASGDVGVEAILSGTVDSFDDTARQRAKVLIAERLGISPDRVEITSVKGGSVVVDFIIHNSNPEPPTNTGSGFVSGDVLPGTTSPPFAQLESQTPKAKDSDSGSDMVLPLVLSGAGALLCAGLIAVVVLKKKRVNSVSTHDFAAVLSGEVVELQDAQYQLSPPASPLASGRLSPARTLIESGRI